MTTPDLVAAIRARLGEQAILRVSPENVDYLVTSCATLLALLDEQEEKRVILEHLVIATNKQTKQAEAEVAHLRTALAEIAAAADRLQDTAFRFSMTPLAPGLYEELRDMLITMRARLTTHAAAIRGAK